MAQITWTISDENLPYFIDCFGEDYDRLVEDDEIDETAITKAQYAKKEAFRFLANRVRKWYRGTESRKIQDIDITQ